MTTSFPQKAPDLRSVPIEKYKVKKHKMAYFTWLDAHD
jgi:hypothetical protein